MFTQPAPCPRLAAGASAKIARGRIRRTNRVLLIALSFLRLVLFQWVEPGSCLMENVPFKQQRVEPSGLEICSTISWPGRIFRWRRAPLRCIIRRAAGGRMYRRTEDFLAEWKHGSKATLNIFDALTDASLGQCVVTGGRTLGQLAWHITLTLGEMLGTAGLHLDGPAESAPVPAQVKVIRDTYEAAAKAVAEHVRQAWPDSILSETVPMYRENWRRGDVLSALLLHEAHHRGQMTVLMRQAGLRVPGTYGPAKED